MSERADQYHACCDERDRLRALLAEAGAMISEFVAGNDRQDDPDRPPGHVAGEFTFADLRAGQSLSERIRKEIGDD